MNYGASEKKNLTAVSIEMIDKLAVASIPIRFQFQVRNNGRERVENVPVRLIVRKGKKEEVALPVKTIRSIDPGQVKRLQFSYIFSTRGSYVIEAKLPADDLIGDNSAYLALEVRKSRRILIVDGEPDITNPINSESYFLVQALDPMGDERYGNKPEVISPEQLPDINLNKYDVVILANVRNLSISPSSIGGEGEYSLLKSLSKYVRSGGGLAIFTGDRVDISFYNGSFYDQGVGLCPARIALPAGRDSDRKTFVRLKRDSIASDWVMRSFHGCLLYTSPSPRD